MYPLYYVLSLIHILMANEALQLHFTPVDRVFSAVTCNGEAVPFEADGFTYSVTMPNENTKLYFQFVVVNKTCLLYTSRCV